MRAYEAAASCMNCNFKDCGYSDSYSNPNYLGLGSWVSGGGGGKKKKVVIIIMPAHTLRELGEEKDNMVWFGGDGNTWVGKNA